MWTISVAAFADDVHAQQLARFAVEQQLEHAGVVAGDLAAGDFAEAGHADFVRHSLFGELLFVLADHRDFGNREQAVGHELARLELAAQHVAGGPAALLHRRAGEGGEADDVADGVDVRHGGLEMRVAADAAAFVDFQAGPVEAEGVGVAGAADAEQHGFAQQPLAAFQFDGDAARLGFANRYDAFAQSEYHAQRAGVVEQRLDDFAVAEFEQLRAAVDDGHLHAERGEHDGVFEADHAAADDDHRTRHVAEREDFVGVEDGLAVERDMARSRRPRAGGQEDVPAFEDLWFAAAGNFDVVRIDERRFAADDVDAVAGELVLEDLPLGLVDVADHQPQVVHRDFAFAAVGLFVDVAVAIAGEVQDRFANGLRGDRAGVERDAAQQFLLAVRRRPRASFVSRRRWLPSGRPVRCPPQSGRIA